MSYDSAGRLTTVTDSLGYASETRFDPLGRTSSVLAPRRAGDTETVILAAAYDSYGRTQRTVSTGLDGASAVRTLTYNAGSRITSETLEASASAWAGYVYDPLSRVTASVASGPAGVFTEATVYDKASLPTSWRWTALGTSGQVTNLYAKTNQWLQTRAFETTWSISTAADGRLMSVGSQLANRMLSYDEAGRLGTVNLGYRAPAITAGVAAWAQTGLAYDSRDRIGRSTLTLASGDANTEDFVYDAAGRLAGWTHGGSAPVIPAGSVDYSYDPAGNLTQRTADGAVTTFAYNEGDQLTSMTAGGVSTTFAFDALGRMTSRTRSGLTTAYAYGASGDLTEVRSDTATATYVYGISGMRERKSVVTSATSETVQSFWDGRQLIAEAHSDGTLLEFLYGPGGIPLELRVTEGTATPADYAYQLDAGGSVVALTDGSGNVVARYAYDPWGAPTYVGGTDPALAELQPLRYRGLYLDAETQLYYLPARFYDPALSRFVTRDAEPPQAGDPTSLNPYLYCGDDPVNRVDPTGESFWSWAKGVVSSARKAAKRAWDVAKKWAKKVTAKAAATREKAVAWAGETKRRWVSGKKRRGSKRRRRPFTNHAVQQRYVYLHGADSPRYPLDFRDLEARCGPTMRDSFTSGYDAQHCETAAEFYDAFNSQPAGSVKRLVVGYHGDEFGNICTDSGEYVDLGKLDPSRFRSDGCVILFSCNSGLPGGAAEFGAESLGVRVWGPAGETSWEAGDGADYVSPKTPPGTAPPAWGWP